MLASDLMNPLFVGSRNPDELMAVEFHWGVVKDYRQKPILDEQGKEKKIPYVRISSPGDDTSVVDTPVREDHKKRWPKQWLYWQMQEGMVGEQADVPGWKISEWGELNEEQKRELLYLRFSVVEQIAGASDLQIQRLGSIGPSLREKAKKALRERLDSSFKSEIEQRDAKIKELSVLGQQQKEAMEELQKQVAKLIETREVTDGVVAEAPKRRGRPPKVV